MPIIEDDIDGPRPEPHLLGISSGLFEYIVTFIESRDLMKFRLVNREIARRIFNKYAEVCFEAVTLQINQTPFLSEAREMIKNKTFNRAIKRVIIDTDDLWIWQLNDDAQSVYLAEFLKALEIDDERELAIEVRQLREPHFKEEDVDEERLGHEMWCAVDYIDPLLHVAMAFRGSSLTIGEFTIGENVWTIPAHKIRDHWPELRSGLFTNITHLELQAWSRDRQGFVDLAKLIAPATKLESLFVRRRRMMLKVGTALHDVFLDERKVFLEKLFESRFANLYDLELDGYQFKLQHLIDFVRKHPKLEYLTLVDCVADEVEGIKQEDELWSDAVVRLTELDDIETAYRKR